MLMGQNRTAAQRWLSLKFSSMVLANCLGVLGGVDWLVAVQVAPESLKERFGTAVLVLDMP